MITAQQARDIVFNQQVKREDEYNKAVKWVEEHIEPHICSYAENERYTLFARVSDEEINPLAVKHALDRNGFAVTCTDIEMAKDKVHEIYRLRISWK